MADESITVQENEVAQTVMFQVRDKDGNTVNEWTAAEDDFKWPAAKKGETRWIKRGERWQQAK